MLLDVIARKLQSALKRIRHRVRYPGNLRWFDTHVGSRTYRACSVALRPHAYLTRTAFAARIPPSNGTELTIPRSAGYACVPPPLDIPIAPALAEADRLIEHMDLVERATRTKKPFLAAIPLQEYLEPQSALLALAEHPAVISAVTSYIGMFPVLRTIQLWYSPNTHFVGRSQQWHMDGEDIRHVKLFIPIVDVEEDSGPLTVIPAKVSRVLYRSLRRDGHARRRNEKFSDDIVGRYVHLRDIVPIVGCRGSLAFVDTCSCYHYGSRPGTRPRIVLMIQYSSPFARDLPWRWRTAEELAFRDFASSGVSSYTALLRGTR